MRTIAVVVTCSALCWTTLARADDTPPAPPSPETPTASEALFEEGRALLADHHAAEACAKFEAALAQEPDAAGVMVNLGLCNVALDKTSTALGWFRKAQNRGFETQHPEMEALAKEQTLALTGKVPTLKLWFAARPHGTVTITLDGAKLADTELARVEVDPGHHVIVAMTELGKTVHELDVVDGDRPSIELDVVKPPKPPTPTVAIDRGPAQRHHALVIGGAGVGVLTATLAAGLVAHHVASDPHTGIDTQLTLRNTFAYIVTPLAVAGLAATAYGAYLYRTAGHQRRQEVVPVVGPQHVGVVFSRTF